VTDATLPPAVRNAHLTVQRVCAVLEWIRMQQQVLSAERDDAILLLADSGLSYEDIARLTGLTRGRVGQIVQPRRSAERRNGG
jgi:DNA-directed RNA polymerase specialized sigma24 family protein